MHPFSAANASLEFSVWFWVSQSVATPFSHGCEPCGAAFPAAKQYDHSQQHLQGETGTLKY